jgi:acyl carrier protein
MPTEDTASTVKRIACHEMMIDEDKVGINDDLRIDHGMDSLDAIEIVMRLEEVFGIGISDEEAEKLHTINDAIRLVVSKGVRQ